MPQHSKKPGSPAFEAVWPAVATRLGVVLARAGAPAWIADDVIQETAIRVLRNWDDLDKTESVLPWAVTVARNLLVDHHRAASKLVAEEPDEDIAIPDVEEAALARVELDRVRRALERLQPRYRAALLAEVGESAQVSTSRLARNSARMRARRQLIAILQTVRGVVVTPVAWLRNGLRSLYLRAARLKNATGIEAFAQGAASVLIAAALLIASNAGSALGDGLTAGGDNGLEAPDLELARATSAGAGDLSPVDGSDPTSGAQVEQDGSDPRDRDPMSLVTHVPYYEGGTEIRNVFGPEGYDLTNNGSTTFGEVSWEQRHRYDTPECVQNAAEGRPPGSCELGDGPSGYVNVTVAGQEHEVKYGT